MLLCPPKPCESKPCPRSLLRSCGTPAQSCGTDRRTYLVSPSQHPKNKNTLRPYFLGIASNSDSLGNYTPIFKVYMYIYIYTPNLLPVRGNLCGHIFTLRPHVQLSDAQMRRKMVLEDLHRKTPSISQFCRYIYLQKLSNLWGK